MVTKPLWATSSLDTFIRRRKTKLGRDTGAKNHLPCQSPRLFQKHVATTTVCPPELVITHSETQPKKLHLLLLPCSIMAFTMIAEGRNHTAGVIFQGTGISQHGIMRQRSRDLTCVSCVCGCVLTCVSRVCGCVLLPYLQGNKNGSYHWG